MGEELFEGHFGGCEGQVSSLEVIKMPERIIIYYFIVRLSGF
jgi:hypothetical protein